MTKDKKITLGQPGCKRDSSSGWRSRRICIDLDGWKVPSFQQQVDYTARKCKHLLYSNLLPTWVVQRRVQRNMWSPHIREDISLHHTQAIPGKRRTFLLLAWERMIDCMIGFSKTKIGVDLHHHVVAHQFCEILARPRVACCWVISLEMR